MVHFNFNYYHITNPIEYKGWFIINEWTNYGWCGKYKNTIEEYQTKMQGWSVLTNLLLVVESVVGTACVIHEFIFFWYYFHWKRSSHSIQKFYSLIIHCDCNYFDLTCHICRYIFYELIADFGLFIKLTNIHISTCNKDIFSFLSIHSNDLHESP